MVIPITVILSILTFVLAMFTATLGFILHTYHKPVFNYHRAFAYLTIIIALINSIFIIKGYYF